MRRIDPDTIVPRQIDVNHGQFGNLLQNLKENRDVRTSGFLSGKEHNIGKVNSHIGQSKSGDAAGADGATGPDLAMTATAELIMGAWEQAGRPVLKPAGPRPPQKIKR